VIKFDSKESGRKRKYFYVKIGGKKVRGKWVELFFKGEKSGLIRGEIAIRIF